MQKVVERFVRKLLQLGINGWFLAANSFNLARGPWITSYVLRRRAER